MSYVLKVTCTKNQEQVFPVIEKHTVDFEKEDMLTAIRNIGEFDYLEAVYFKDFPMQLVGMVDEEGLYKENNHRLILNPLYTLNFEIAGNLILLAVDESNPSELRSLTEKECKILLADERKIILRAMTKE